MEDIQGFRELYRKLEQEIVISGKSQSMLNSYARHLAKIALQLNCLPTELTETQIREYLFFIRQNHPTVSESFYKFTVYSLRLVFRINGQNDKAVMLPSFKCCRKLPVVLSRAEVKQLLVVAENRKHRILLFLLYGCGLRCGEVRNLRIADIDFDRMMLLVKNGKGGRDRYVPLSSYFVLELQAYIKTENREYLFGKPTGRSGGDFDTRYSQRGISWVLKHLQKKTSIIKNISPHILRHTYATHLLEDGLDVFMIKDLLGHSRIETTMVYLHVSHFERIRAFSPLDTLYDPHQVGRMRAMSPFSNN